MKAGRAIAVSTKTLNSEAPVFFKSWRGGERALWEGRRAQLEKIYSAPLIDFTIDEGCRESWEDPVREGKMENGENLSKYRKFTRCSMRGVRAARLTHSTEERRYD
jgi:hypothetical protein